MNFQFDTTAGGHTMKMLAMIDEFTRDALAIGINADGDVAALDSRCHRSWGAALCALRQASRGRGARRRRLVPVQPCRFTSD